ncbi:MAG: hypothetical protein GEV12_05805 [Micromonosporaceae bacterium]|nr:hypothetical protein [Micromonosporaceae bacterium]
MDTPAGFDAHREWERRLHEARLSVLDWPHPATAKLVAADAARDAVTAALQVHGAIGYTDEHPLSLWLRRVTALRSAWGSPAAHRELVAAALAAGDAGHLGQPPDPLPSTATGGTAVATAGQEATVPAARDA